MSEADATKMVEVKKGAIATLFGQFATKDFWKSLFGLIVKEAVSAFILSLGGTLVYYIKGKTNADIRNISYGGSSAQASTNPSNAFSGFQRPGYSPTPPAGAAPSYPGFA